ncbi:MAG: saccharopine dehydrogenase C-terminal domain-containing protein [Pseudomonadota bacterium]
MKYVILGCGRVGRLIARDLALDDDAEVVSVDANPTALLGLDPYGISGVTADLSDPSEIARVVAGADVAVNAVPGFMGLATLGAAVAAGIPAVDIAFMPEDPGSLDAAARAAGVPVVVDFGVAPGISNLLVGHGARRLDTALRARILVGGLPKVRQLPWEYTIPFSPVDVLEEYTRPARIVEHGEEVIRAPLTERELVELPRIGTLEAFNSDGLRTLIRTMDIPHMVEKTLRYPGYAEKVQLLASTGFFSRAPVDIGGVSVRPMDLTARLLFDAWRLREDQDELTVMRVEVEGTLGGAPTCLTWDLYDETDRVGDATSMARCTGFPAALMARAVADGRFCRPGVFAPEEVAEDDALVGWLLGELVARGVILEERIERG